MSFKVGDLIRVKNNCGYAAIRNTTGTISGIDTSCTPHQYIVSFVNTGTWRLYENEIEHEPLHNQSYKFAIGDTIIVNTTAVNKKYHGLNGYVTAYVRHPGKSLLFEVLLADGSKKNFKETSIDNLNAKPIKYKVGDSIEIIKSDDFYIGCRGVVSSVTFDITGPVVEWYNITIPSRAGSIGSYKAEHIQHVGPRATPQSTFIPAKAIPIVTIQDAIRLELEMKKPRYIGTPAEWYAQGKCPQCGELGRYHISATVCSKHGVY